MTFEPGSLSTSELLHAYGQILDELRLREVIRTSNSPVGDYAEWLVSNHLGLTLQPNSARGHDAEDSTGLRIQIKGRRLTARNQSRQLSGIRDLKGGDFDFLIAVLFDEHMEIEQVLRMSHEAVCRYARFSPHTNPHILVLQGAVLSDPMVEDITARFRQEPGV